MVNLKSTGNKGSGSFNVPMGDPDAAGGLAYLVLAKLQAYQSKLSGALKKVQSEMLTMQSNSATEQASAQKGAAVASGFDNVFSGMVNFGTTGYGMKKVADKESSFKTHTKKIAELDSQVNIHEKDDAIGKKGPKINTDAMKKQRSELERRRDHELSTHDHELSRVQNILSPAITAVSKGASSFGEGSERASDTMFASQQQIESQMEKNFDQNAQSAVELARTFANENPGAVALAGARG
ncbi:MAG: hypothetical protein S4CHLAM37_11750 [Chlamydiia bacterium]|nr:hypothetical protein [Chlamydiia bacterium]